MSESKTKTKVYLFHEVSSYLPLLEGEEFEALVEDIKQFGQIEPIVLYEGKILDGRNRYRACTKLRIEVLVNEWKPSEATGLTPLQYVISTNIMRRHLGKAQRSEIGLLLIEEEERLTKERMSEITKKRERDENGKLLDNKKIDDLVDAEKFGEKGRSLDKVGKKVKVNPTYISQAKKIKEIAKDHPTIAEDWEKAKKEETSIESVFQKAKVVEEAQKLPLRQREEVMLELRKDEIPAKQLRKILQDKKDDVKRINLAKKTRELQKRKQEMDKLHLQIRALEKSIEELENARKGRKANLKVLTEEASKKYPKYASEDSDYVLTKLSNHYDSLDMGMLDLKIANLKKEYDALMQPLREELERLESEFQQKKTVIDKEKEAINKEVIWIERHQNAMTSEYDTLEVYQDKIEENKETLLKLQEKYDSEFKDL